MGIDRRVTTLVVLVGLIIELAGCGGGGGSTASQNPVPAPMSLSPPTATAGAAAFVLTVTGSNFVSSSTVYWNGSSRQTMYSSATSISAQISAADIARAGSASVTVVTPPPGGGTSAPQSFSIVAPNPAPSLTSITPARTAPGGPAFTLTATGANFIASSVLNWNGSARPTTMVSTTQLTAQITAADIAGAGSAAVTALTPAPGGGTSAPQSFTITALDVPVHQIAPGGSMSQSAHYQLVGTVGPPPDSTLASSQHYTLQGGLAGAGASVP